MRGRVLVPALTALALLLAACGGGGEQAGGGTTTTPATSSGASSASPPSTSAPGTTGHAENGHDGADHAPPFPADTRPDTGQASAGASGNITDVRIGHHDGFDRVVFEFHGTGTPGWTVRYVPQATAQGSGQPIDLAGNAVLEVTITGVGYPADTGVQEYPTGRYSVAHTDAVTEVYFGGTFEGQTQAFVGAAAQTPFRVYLLQDPARVVVEVREQ